MVVEGPNKIHKVVRLFHDLIERGDVIECEKLHKKHNLDVNIPLVRFIFLKSFLRFVGRNLGAECRRCEKSFSF